MNAYSDAGVSANHLGIRPRVCAKSLGGLVKPIEDGIAPAIWDERIVKWPPEFLTGPDARTHGKDDS